MPRLPLGWNRCPQLENPKTLAVRVWLNENNRKQDRFRLSGAALHLPRFWYLSSHSW